MKLVPSSSQNKSPPVELFVARHASAFWKILAHSLTRLGCWDPPSTPSRGVTNHGNGGRAAVADDVQWRPPPADQPQLWCLHGAAESIQHPLKAQLHEKFNGNGDRSLITSHAIGVADGVSSVAEEGYDPGCFSAECLAKCYELMLARETDPRLFDQESRRLIASLALCYDVKDFVRHIVARAASATQEMGSTTLCFAVLKETHLHVVNIGDSGLLLFRLMEGPSRPGGNRRAASGSAHALVARSSDTRHRKSGASGYNRANAAHQCSTDVTAPFTPSLDSSALPKKAYRLVGRTHPSCSSFNNPFQITRMPEPLPPTPTQLFEETYLRSSSTMFALKDGDIIVATTDGVLDNLHVSQIIEVLNSLCLPSVPDFPFEGISHVPLVPPETVAKEIVKAATLCADPTYAGSYPTPFSDALYALTGKRINGGKSDDVTAVVAYVQAATPAVSQNLVSSALELRSALLRNPYDARDAGDSIMQYSSGPHDDTCSSVKECKTRAFWAECPSNRGSYHASVFSPLSDTPLRETGSQARSADRISPRVRGTGSGATFLAASTQGEDRSLASPRQGRQASPSYSSILPGEGGYSECSLNPPSRHRNLLVHAEPEPPAIVAPSPVLNASIAPWNFQQKMPENQPVSTFPIQHTTRLPSSLPPPTYCSSSKKQRYYNSLIGDRSTGLTLSSTQLACRPPPSAEQRATVGKTPETLDRKTNNFTGQGLDATYAPFQPGHLAVFKKRGPCCTGPSLQLWTSHWGGTASSGSSVPKISASRKQVKGCCFFR